MNIAVLTSGGDSPGMNAAIRAVTRAALSEHGRAYGFLEGFRGLSENDYTALRHESVSETIDRGGTILRTSRYNDFKDPRVQARAAENLKSLNIDALIVVGGNGSMQGAEALARQGVSVIGIPASIDNDVNGSDFSIGFDTAVNTVLENLSRLRDTASAHERIFVVEVMGRECGAIALNAGMAGGADHICLPETPVDERQITLISAVVEERIRQGKTHTLIILAEGSGSAEPTAKAIMDRTGRDTRFSVLGHIQRGGSPSAQDRLLACRLGVAAVESAEAGKSGVMIGLVGNRTVETPLAETYSVRVQTDPELLRLASILS